MGAFTDIPTRTNEFKFREEYHEVIRLKALGYKTRDIARELNLAYHTVQQALSSPFGRRLLADIQDARTGSVMDISDRIKAMANDAIDYMEDIMDGSVDVTAGLKFKVAESILDRAGHGRITKNLMLGLTGTLSADDVKAIRERAQAAGIVNVTPSQPEAGDSNGQA